MAAAADAVPGPDGHGAEGLDYEVGVYSGCVGESAGDGSLGVRGFRGGLLGCWLEDWKVIWLELKEGRGWDAFNLS